MSWRRAKARILRHSRLKAPGSLPQPETGSIAASSIIERKGLLRNGFSSTFQEQHPFMPDPSNVAALKALVRTVPDFPKPGILFYDITTMLKDKTGLAMLIDELAAH